MSRIIPVTDSSFSFYVFVKMIDKGKYALDGKKAFFTARLRVGPGPKDFTSCNFILTSEGSGEDACWLIDSILIRPESMRRRRRR